MLHVYKYNFKTLSRYSRLSELIFVLGAWRAETWNRVDHGPDSQTLLRPQPDAVFYHSNYSY